MADLRVNFCGVELKNPITTASGTFGFGHEYGEFFDLSQLGGIGVKGLTPTERLGNPAPRIAETPQGILNCVGLQNPGIDKVIEEELPKLSKCSHKKVIANVGGFSSRSRFRSCAGTTPKLSPMSPATRSRSTRAWSRRFRMRMLTLSR